GSSGILEDERLTPVADHDPFAASDLQIRHRTLLVWRDPGAQRGAGAPGCPLPAGPNACMQDFRRNLGLPLALATSVEGSPRARAGRAAASLEASPRRGLACPVRQATAPTPSGLSAAR